MRFSLHILFRPDLPILILGYLHDLSFPRTSLLNSGKRIVQLVLVLLESGVDVVVPPFKVGGPAREDVYMDMRYRLASRGAVLIVRNLTSVFYSSPPAVRRKWTDLTAHGQTLTFIYPFDNLADLLYREEQVRDLRRREVGQPRDRSHGTNQDVCVSPEGVGKLSIIG